MNIKLFTYYRLYIGKDKIGVINLKGGYKAFWFVYALGWKNKDGKWKKIWCRPYFYYVDTKKVIRHLERTFNVERKDNE